MQSGAFGLVFEQQLEQARLDAEGARQVAENWKGQAASWEDRVVQAVEKLAKFGGKSGADTQTF